MIEITLVRHPEDAALVAEMVREMIAWLYQRYPHMTDVVDAYVAAQNIDHQLNNLLTIFAPPRSELLLARLNGAPVGIVMLKPHPSGACEMNRMFVRPAARGHKVGEAMARRLIERARELGYVRMVLSAGPDHHEALPLYRKLGFTLDPSLGDTGAGDAEIRMGLSL